MLTFPFHNRCLTSVLCVLSIFICSFVLASDSYATDIIADDGNLQVNASICYPAFVNGRQYYACGSERQMVLSAEGTIDDRVIYYDFNHSGYWLGDDISLANLINDFDNYDCDTVRQCYLKITKVIYNPYLHNGSYNDRQAVYVPTDEYFDFKMTIPNNQRPFYFGDGEQFYTFANGYTFVYGGLDTYLNFNLSTQYSCLDNIDDPCEMRYYFFHSADDLSSDGVFSSLITRGKATTPIYSFMPVDNPYDTNYEAYDRSAYNSLLFFYPIHESDTYWFNVQIEFSYGDEFHQWQDGNSLDPDDIDIEWDRIQDNLQSADDLLDTLVFNPVIPNPISGIINSFEDETCTTISIIPSWFGLQAQTICSPWRNNLRTTLTPIFILLCNFLIFGFVVSWLKKGDQV